MPKTNQRTAQKPATKYPNHGGYEGLAFAWGEFLAWVAAGGHNTTTDLWERYLVRPETSPEPSDWRTELIQPLLG